MDAFIWMWLYLMRPYNRVQKDRGYLFLFIQFSLPQKNNGNTKYFILKSPRFLYIFLSWQVLDLLGLVCLLVHFINKGWALLPQSFSPQSFLPQSFSPQSFSPQSFSPQSFSPQLFSPQSFSPQSFSPQSFSPQSFSPLFHFNVIIVGRNHFFLCSGIAVWDSCTGRREVCWRRPWSVWRSFRWFSPGKLHIPC